MTTFTQVIGLKVIRPDMLCHGERIQAASAQPRRRILRVSHSDTGAVSEPFNDTTARQFCRRKRVRTLVKGQKIHGSVANLPQNRVIECPEGESYTGIAAAVHGYCAHAITIHISLVFGLLRTRPRGRPSLPQICLSVLCCKWMALTGWMSTERYKCIGNRCRYDVDRIYLVVQ